MSVLPEGRGKAREGELPVAASFERVDAAEGLSPVSPSSLDACPELMAVKGWCSSASLSTQYHQMTKQECLRMLGMARGGREECWV